MIDYLRSFLTREAAGQLSKMASIGVLNTAVYFGLINLFRTVGVPLLTRTLLAFVLATVLSYYLNRLWTFRIRGTRAGLAESMGFFLINGIAMVVTAAIVLAADAVLGPEPMTRLQENLANLVAGAVLLLPKLAGYRDLVFARSLRRTAEAADPDAGRVPTDLP